MKIIKARLEHKEELKKLNIEFDRFLNESIRTEFQRKVASSVDYSRSVEEEISRFLGDDVHTLIAIDQEAVIGYITGEIRLRPSKNYNSYGYIEDIFILESYREEGIGKLLIEEMRKYFVANDCKYISLPCNFLNREAINFYKKNDFIPSSIEFRMDLS
jgi:ribosomal protein S18 acetylase RimI-like enzyme